MITFWDSYKFYFIFSKITRGGGNIKTPIEGSDLFCTWKGFSKKNYFKLSPTPLFLAYYLINPEKRVIIAWKHISQWPQFLVRADDQQLRLLFFFQRLPTEFWGAIIQTNLSMEVQASATTFIFKFSIYLASSPQIQASSTVSDTKQ